MKLRFTTYRTNVRIMIAAYLVIGLTLILQPNKYESTPSYGNLLEILPAWAWGVLYLAASFSLVFTRFKFANGNVIISTVSHTYVSALTASWLVAFVIRYLTDSGTTIVNVVSWSVFLALLLISSFDLTDILVVEPTPDLPVKSEESL